MKLLAAALLIVATGATGCVVRGGVTGRVYVPPPPVYSVSVNANAGYNDAYYEPDMVEVSPGVRVVYDYDEPVFYSDNYYWRYNNNVWYRSSRHNSGWTVYGDVPYSVRGIQQPNAYVHYRPSNYTPVRNRPGQQGYQQPRNQPQPYNGGPTVRDHRGPSTYVAPQPVNTGPTVRDHRTPQPQPAPQPAGPTVRDHRAPAPQPATPTPNGPTVRDHRHN